MPAAGGQSWRSPHPPLPDWGGSCSPPPAHPLLHDAGLDPDALRQDPTVPYVPSLPLQSWHPQVSQMRFVVSS